MKNAIESDDFSQLAAVIQKGLAKGIRREKLYYSDLGLGLIGAGEDEHILLAAASAGATRVAMYLIGSHGLKFNGGLCTALLPPSQLTKSEPPWCLVCGCYVSISKQLRSLLQARVNSAHNTCFW